MLSLNRMRTAFDRAFRNEQNENLDMIEQASNSLQSQINSLVDGNFDEAALNTHIEEKLNDLETQYAPKLTEVSEQLADIAINVKSLGAKGDGISDDTEILQYAFDNFDTILLPMGTYKTTKPLTFLGSKSIKGIGVGKSFIKKAGNAKLPTSRKYRHKNNLPEIDYADYDAILISLDYSGEISLQNLEINGDSSSRNDYGLLFPYTYRVLLDDVQVTNCKDNIRFFQTWNTNLRKVRSRDSDYGFRVEGIGENDSVIEQSTSIHFDNTFAENTKFGYKCVNLTYFSGTAMSADYITKCAYWFDACQGEIAGLGIEQSEGQFIRNWRSNISIGGVFALNNINHLGLTEQAKSKAKIEVWSVNRTDTGLTIDGAELRALSGSGDASLYYVGGSSQLFLINARDSGIRSTLSENDTIESNSTLQLYTRSFSEIGSINTKIKGTNSLDVGDFTLLNPLRGYNIDSVCRSEIDGFEFVRTTSSSINTITVPLAEIRKRFPNFMHSDTWISIPYKLSIYGQNGKCVVDLYLIKNTLNTTHVKSFNSAPSVTSVSIVDTNFVITLSEGMQHVFLHIQKA